MAINTQRVVWIVLGVSVAALVLFWLARQWGSPVATVARARSGTAVNAVVGNVVIEAAYAMELKSDVSGRVSRSWMELDRRVSTGDKLVQVDTGDIDIQIAQARSDLLLAQKRIQIGSPVALELAAAKDQFAEAQRQKAAGLLPDVEVTRFRRALESVQQRFDLDTASNLHAVDNLENALKALERTRDKMTIYAPFDGVLTQLYARPGELVGGGTPIARILAVGRKVEARLSEENISGVKVGHKAIVSFLPYGDRQFDAKVVKVLSSSDPSTQRYPVHLEIDPSQLSPEQLVPGITGEASIIIDEREASTIIPRRALVADQVLVVKSGLVEQRKVRRGYLSLTAVEILEGLSAGEWVIVAELDQFRDGRAVRMVPVQDPQWR
jgi:RND family efflux transporter MFP subunit